MWTNIELCLVQFYVFLKYLSLSLSIILDLDHYKLRECVSKVGWLDSWWHHNINPETKLEPLSFPSNFKERISAFSSFEMNGNNLVQWWYNSYSCLSQFSCQDNINNVFNLGAEWIQIWIPPRWKMSHSIWSPSSYSSTYSQTILQLLNKWLLTDDAPNGWQDDMSDILCEWRMSGKLAFLSAIFR